MDTPTDERDRKDRPRGDPALADPRARRTVTPWKAALPLAFVVVGLIALAAIPALMNRWIGAHQHEIENVTQPARAVVTSIESHLAHEVSLTRGHLLTGDPAFVERYLEVHEEHQRLYDRLRPLVRQMGPEVQGYFAELEQLVEQRAATTASYLTGELSAAEFAQELPARQVVFEEALATIQRLEWAILTAEQRHRDRMARLRSWDLWLTIVLVGLALAASVVILLIGRRDLRLLADAERHRLELAQLVETRSRLIRGIGHDVKNPLGAADGYAELLEEGLQGELTQEQQHYVGRIRRMNRSVLDIINNLLEFARAESGELSVELSEAAIDEIVRETAEDYRAAAERGGLDFEVAVPGELPAVRTDPVRVRAIFGNLLSNAIKYTPRGGEIRVHTEVRQNGDAPEPGSWVTILVEDTGPGIPQEACERIFGEYERLDPGAAEGAGIGLAISRTVARALGGDITVRSALGEGSIFTLWLPARNGLVGTDG
jgi:signal transduction histidine kinase